MDCPASTRKKSWHESKHLRKRAAFLLEDTTLIPQNVCFRVGADKLEQPVDITGHKIFFALASPVFHAMFYGDMKEKKKVVHIPDVTPEAFQCLKTYVYSDSFATINNVTVMNVLAASKKYQISKLTRYCYEFVQKNPVAALGRTLSV